MSRSSFLVRPLGPALLALCLAACSSSRDAGRAGAAARGGPSRSAAPAEVRGRAVPPNPSAEIQATGVGGDAQHGSALVLRFECNRCHDGTGHPAMATEKHCTHCHEDISTGRFGAGSAKIGEWRRSVAPYRYAPSLEGAGKRFRREWLVSFLQNPEDLRPHLAATMPRLAISKGDAIDLAAYLTRGASPERGAPLAGGRAEAGRALMEAKGCGSCHTFTGAPPFPSTPSLQAGSDAQKKAVQLAPDLSHARERFRADALVDWLVSPVTLKADTVMPSHGLTGKEATDIATYLLRAELVAPVAAVAPPPVGARLPLLARPVTYAEVEKRVLSVTCRHCHGNPDVAGGDGGPGNTGGFGFAPRGLDLSTYRSALSGLLRDDAERHSLFEKTADGTPLLVLALRARESEEAGRPVPGIRGMPLGLPAVPPEDVQLVDTWIAQGRPR